MSYYWGGQLEEVASSKGVNRGLKTNTESRFYALILQALSVKDYKASLMEICGHDGAQRKINGLTPVNADVVATVFDLARWRMTDQIIRISLGIVQRWGWSKEMAQNLTQDLKAYHNGDAPFTGGKPDGKDWWKSLVVNITLHPLKALATFSIPHAAEIERFFSNLGGIQLVKRSNLTTEHMKTFRTLQNSYVC
ncbi:hypothetical protein B0H34DRAFT_799945 [Crassisporium funariophilum]|nr:hypothetical protein B0H34DRAFT_799945 [Crassisporium funariophilum]